VGILIKKLPQFQVVINAGTLSIAPFELKVSKVDLKSEKAENKHEVSTFISHIRTQRLLQGNGQSKSSYPNLYSRINGDEPNAGTHIVVVLGIVRWHHNALIVRQTLAASWLLENKNSN